MPLCKWHTFWMAPYLICLFFVSLFFVILFYIEIKWLLMRNVAAIVPLKSKLSGKFQRFNAINRCIEMLKIVEFSKISIKTQKSNRLKNFFQSPLIPPPHHHPTRTNLTTSRKQFFLRRYIEIYWHLLVKWFKNAVIGRQEIV